MDDKQTAPAAAAAPAAGETKYSTMVKPLDPDVETHYSKPVRDGFAPPRTLNGRVVDSLTTADFNEPTVTMVFPAAVRLRLPDHRVVQFFAGVHEVPQSLADHWYLRANGVRRYDSARAPAAVTAQKEEADRLAADRAEADELLATKRAADREAADAKFLADAEAAQATAEANRVAADKKAAAEKAAAEKTAPKPKAK